MEQSRLDESLISVSSADEIPMDHFERVMQRNTFACIRGIVSAEEVAAGLQALTDQFSRADDHPAVGQKSDAVRSNFQKLNVGGESLTRSNTDARLFRAFYNPIWDEDVYGLRAAFIRLAMVRNRIAGLPRDFAIREIADNGLWTAARIHQYPAGGGFFRRHTDYVVSDVADKAGTDFFQTLMLLTQKGEHFQTGGGFVDVDGERLYLEDYFGPGDIVVYDGRTVHGVEDVDPHLPLDLDTINGRVAAFATLFKVMA